MGAILRAREKRAVFDLEHLLALSDAPGLPLLVSERTLYLLENLAITDITDASRFSLGPVEDNFYMTVDEEDEEEYALFLDVLHQAQLEILEVEQMFYGYEEAFGDFETLITGGSGNTSLEGSVVPEGELWECQLAAGVASAVCAAVLVYISDGETIFYLAEGIPNIAGQHVYWSGKVALSPGQRMGCLFAAHPDATTLNAHFWYAKLV